MTGSVLWQLRAGNDRSLKWRWDKELEVGIGEGEVRGWEV